MSVLQANRTQPARANINDVYHKRETVPAKALLRSSNEKVAEAGVCRPTRAQRELETFRIHGFVGWNTDVGGLELQSQLDAQMRIPALFEGIQKKSAQRLKSASEMRVA